MFVNKAGQALSITDIPTTWLCPNCKGIITDYCAAALAVDRVNLSETSVRILADIKHHSGKTKNPILRALYRDLKIEVQSILNQPEKKNRIFLLLIHLANENAANDG
jgi:hypothetical protein